MDIYNLSSINLSLKNSRSLMKKIHYFEEIDSTNTHLKNNLSNYRTGDIILAESQTMGRGRNNRKWYSKKSQGLYFSILLKNTMDLHELNFLSLLAATSINRVLQKMGFTCKIKWPNDIYINDKKICGILIENIMDSNINNTIIGIGINVNTDSFDDQLKDRASSLYLESNRQKFNSYKILYRILKSLEEDILTYMTNMDTSDFIDYIKSNSMNLGRTISLNLSGELITGILLDILPDGSIKILDKNNHSLVINYGEIINH